MIVTAGVTTRKSIFKMTTVRRQTLKKTCTYFCLVLFTSPDSFFIVLTHTDNSSNLNYNGKLYFHTNGKLLDVYMECWWSQVYIRLHVLCCNHWLQVH